MDVNPQIAKLITRAASALRNRPALGGAVCIDFGKDGSVLVNKSNQVYSVLGHAPVDCTITLSLDTLTKLETASPWQQALMLCNGDIAVEGNRELARKLAESLKAAM